MANKIELRNCLSRATEAYSSPPWRLEGITPHSRGSLVRLIDAEGEKCCVPVMMQAEFLNDILRHGQNRSVTSHPAIPAN